MSRRPVDVAALRLRNQRLVGVPFGSPEEVVAWLGAVQSQDYAGAKWAVGQRVRRCGDGDVEQAVASGRILRTHVLRPTWHFVAAADLRWMLRLTAPRVRAAMAYYDRTLGLDAATYARSNDAMARALEGGRQLTREQLGAALAKAGIVAKTQKLGHLAARAELDAVICSGARQGKQQTYALVDERVPPAPALARDEALAELTRRYFRGHGPAQPHDFAWWSGLTVSDARAGIGSLGAELERVTAGDKEYWLAPPARAPRLAGPRVHLLPNYDEYLVAYKDHSVAFEAAAAAGRGPVERILANHFVVVNGRIAGGWRRLAGRKEVVVEARLFGRLGKRERVALGAEVERLGGFLGVAARLERVQ